MVKSVGTKNSSYIYKISCNNCASNLEYVKNDIIDESYTDIDGSRGSQGVVICPDCDGKIVVRTW